MALRKLEHEVYSSGDRKMGHVWLGEDNKVDSDSTTLLNILSKKTAPGVNFYDGEKFLRNITSVLRNGYIHAQKVNS